MLTDTVSDVVDDRAERPPRRERREVVNNSAAAQSSAGAPPAAAPSPSLLTHPARIRVRTRAARPACRLTPKRTTPREGSRISPVQPRQVKAERRQSSKTATTNLKLNKMPAWEDYQHYAGLDWASDHHDLIVVNRAGRVESCLRLAHDAAGWARARAVLTQFGLPPVAVETNQGTVIELLLASGSTVYPVTPLSAKRYRERKAPSGVKDDQLDAWSLADALRVDGHGWKPLAPEDPLVAELRLICRDEIALIEQRTALVNGLRAALREYYPTALQAFEDWTREATWQFVLQFPTPAELVKAGRRRWEKFLHVHRLWRPGTAEARLALFADALSFCGGPALTKAKSLQAVSLCKVLLTLEAQLRLYRARIEELFAEHPDHDLFGSLPGAGGKLAPRLLAEIGQDRDRFEEANALQCYAGTAPVTVRSGKVIDHRFRRAANPVLRASVHLWVDLSRK